MVLGFDFWSIHEMLRNREDASSGVTNEGPNTIQEVLEALEVPCEELSFVGYFEGNNVPPSNKHKNQEEGHVEHVLF